MKYLVNEFDEVRWFPSDEALSVMTHATERGVVEDLGLQPLVGHEAAGER